MSTYGVTAKRWEHGWELHVDGVGVTQSITLAGAKQQVRDYIATVNDLEECTDEIDINVELGGLEDEARRATEDNVRAAAAQRRAAAQSRDVARKLRSAGLSVTDTAAVMGVSRGRVSQLTKV